MAGSKAMLGPQYEPQLLGLVLDAELCLGKQMTVWPKQLFLGYISRLLSLILRVSWKESMLPPLA